MKIDGAGAVLVIHVISEMKRRGRLIVKIHESDDTRYCIIVNRR